MRWHGKKKVVFLTNRTGLTAQPASSGVLVDIIIGQYVHVEETIL